MVTAGISCSGSHTSPFLPEQLRGVYLGMPLTKLKELRPYVVGIGRTGILIEELRDDPRFIRAKYIFDKDKRLAGVALAVPKRVNDNDVFQFAQEHGGKLTDEEYGARGKLQAIWKRNDVVLDLYRFNSRYRLIYGVVRAKYWYADTGRALSLDEWNPNRER